MSDPRLRPLRFAWATAAATLRGPPLTPTVMLFVHMLTASLPVVFVVALATGAMLTVQAAVSLGPFGGASMSGLIVGFGGVREVFPLITAGAVAARSGAEFAAELGAMKTTQQVDALEVMGLDPVRLLVVPRVIAAALATPLCVLCACGAGMLGAQLTGTLQLHVDRGLMWSTLWQGVVLADLIVAAIKGVVLGVLIGLVATREGLRAEGGPAGVGRAANRAVVVAMCVACAADFVISMAVYGPGAAP